MRAQERTRLELQGKLFNPINQCEESCFVLDLSPNGAGLKTACAAPTGLRVVLYVNDLGRFEGTVVRRDRLYIGVQFKYSEAARDRIAGKIASYLEHGTSTYTPTRDSGRFAVAGLRHSFTLASGQNSPCEIVDIALSGISVKASVRPELGEHLFFGKTEVVVARHTEVGFAVGFCSRA